MMPLWKRPLLSAWYYATAPCRAWANRRAAQRGRAPVIVLFYHRVADDQPNDWTLATAQFERQIAWMRARFDLVSLEEAQRRIASGCCRRPAVSITFDDGYADNCRHALPLLVKERIPVAYFVSTKHLLTGQPFPHDVAAGAALPPNSVEEIKALAAAGVEIGGHTHAHVNLGAIHDEARLREEVLGSARRLEQITGRPVRYFAFPYGLPENLNPRVFALVREAGMCGVLSAYGGYNFPGDDAFHLQRIHADADFLRFRNWLTVDPRKVRTVRRYDYEAAATAAAMRQEALRR